MSEDPQQSAEFLLGRLANEQETNRKLLESWDKFEDETEKLNTEIERLKRSYTAILESRDKSEAEIKRHKHLHTRAADALEYYLPAHRGKLVELIAELRKAAE